MKLRRKPFPWACPQCGGTFATIHVSMTRRHNRLPDLQSMRGDIICDSCGTIDDEAHYVARSRGWPQHGQTRKEQT